ncbi:MAG: hypothetical protein GY754_29175 [bacterium]|nr:hypothetical protein [bacterium]
MTEYNSTEEKFFYFESLRDISKKYGYDLNVLLELNPFYDEDTDISGYVTVPVKHKTDSLEHNNDDNEEEKNNSSEKKKEKESKNTILKSNVYRRLIMMIQPKIREINEQIVIFNRSTFYIERKMKKEKQLIVTHRHLWFGTGKNIENRLFRKKESDAYIEYQKEIFKNYKKSMEQMGMFFRGMTYFYHLVFHTEFFEIKQQKKFGDALSFMNAFLNVILGRINKYLFYILHEYQMLNGSFQDWVIYQNIIKLVDLSFGELSKFFSTKGKMNHYTRFPLTFFVYKNMLYSRLASITKGVDGVIINDEFIFNYSVDYSNKSQVNKTRDKLDDKLNKAAGKMFDDFDTKLAEAQTLYTGHYLKNIRKEISTKKTELNKFLANHPDAKKLKMQGEIDTLIANARRGVVEAQDKFNSAKKFNSNVEKSVAGASIKFISLEVALGLYALAGIVKKEVGPFDSLFVNEESFYNDIRQKIKQLVRISEKSDPASAQIQLAELSSQLDQYRLTAQKLIEDGNFWGDLVAEILILIAVCILTWGIGAAVGGMLKALSITGTALRVSTFAVDVLSFCVFHEAISKKVHNRKFFNGSIKQFGISLASTAIMFGVFKGMGRIVQRLVKAHAITSKVAVFFISFSANFLTSTIVSAPFFAAQLLANGQNLFSRREWGKFLITHGITAAMFGLFHVANGRIESIQKRISNSSFHMTSRIKGKIQKIKANIQKARIEQKINEIKNIWEKLDKKYKGMVTIDRKLFDEFRQQYQSAANKGKTLLKQLKQIQKDLLTVEYYLKRGSQSLDIAPEGELVAIEHSISQIETWMTQMGKTGYIPDMRYQLACTVHDALPKGAGIKPINAGKDYYAGLISKLTENASALQDIKIKDFGKYPIRMIEYKPTADMDAADIKGVVKFQALIEKGNMRDLIEITVFDKYGGGQVPSSVLKKEYALQKYRGQSEGDLNQEYSTTRYRPIPNKTRSIFIYVFRGTRKTVTDLKRKLKTDPENVTLIDFLSGAGHVGFSFEGKGKTIWGFGPDASKYPELSPNELWNKLMDREKFIGLITDDTAVFQNAASNPDIREGVSVIEYSYKTSRFNDIYKKFLTMRKSPGKYMFPRNEAPHFDSETANCATWPQKVGIEIPEQSGLLNKYQPASVTKAKTNPNKID